jgi:Na+/H+ antiporter NhaD/arsenite permease-like protein
MPISTQHLLLWITFAVTYIGIAFGRLPRLALDRTGIAILGAIAMLLLNGLSIEQAFSPDVVNYETLVLLFGLMIFSAQLQTAGFYSFCGRFIEKIVDRPNLLVAAVVAISAGLSALLANDIICLAFTPMLCIALLRLGRDPIPYLIALAMAANIGSAATLIGNPQNMYIGAVANLPFLHYFLVMLPIILLGLVLCWAAIVLLFHRRLHDPVDSILGKAQQSPGERNPESRPSLSMREEPLHPWLTIKTLILLAAVVICFLFAPGPWRAVAALAGAGVLLCSRRPHAATLYEKINWNLILLFLGLFIVNGAMARHHLTDQLFQAVRDTGVNLHHPIDLSAVTLLLSNLISNVPAVLLLQPAIPLHDRQSWYLLALISTWAGNLTLVGSIANLIVAESAAEFGLRLELKTYCKAGIPLTILTVLLGTAWLIWVM